jgi:uncharacterized protein
MDIATLLRSARQEAGLTQRELAHRAGTSQPTLARYERGQAVPGFPTLERLLAAAGKRLHLTVEDLDGAHTAPIWQLLDSHRSAVRRILREHGVRRALVFGSVARGEDTAASDLDLLVELHRPTYVRLAALREELQEELGIPVDVTVTALLDDDVRRAVEEEAVAL